MAWLWNYIDVQWIIIHLIGIVFQKSAMDEEEEEFEDEEEDESIEDDDDEDADDEDEDEEEHNGNAPPGVSTSTIVDDICFLC